MNERASDAADYDKVTFYSSANGTPQSSMPSTGTNYEGWFEKRVGDIIMTTASYDPRSLYGGTWTKIVDRFLVGAGNSYGVNSTGGNSTHTHTQGATGSTVLTENQIPSHRHSKLFVDVTQVGFSNVGVNSSGYVRALNPQDAGGKYDGIHTGYTGGGQGHTHTNPTTNSASTIPPYYGIYIWRRTA